jgi:hypothetical protein
MEPSVASPKCDKLRVHLPAPLTILQRIRGLLQDARPDLNVAIAIYPQYETRGELSNAVARFREWLQNKVIDIEVESRTPHPQINPTVHTILVGHSMGGIVAADTLLSIMDDDVVAGASKLAFPHIVGILAFDTPYLGLAPSVLTHSAQEKWKSATAAYSTFSSITSGLFATQAAVEGTKSSTPQQERERRESENEKNELVDQSLWGKWGKVAAYGGAAAALAGGAAAAYIKRDDIGAGFGWVQSHLEFVGVLMKAQELLDRVTRASTIEGVSFANLFTSLGGDRMGTSMLYQGKERTFCSLPEEDSPLRKLFFRCVNGEAADEVAAHCSMFELKTNPAFEELVDRAKGLVCLWVPKDAFPLIDEEDFGSYDYERTALARASAFEKESKSSKSSRRSSRDHDGSGRSSRDHGKSSSSRDLERTDSGRSSRSGHDKDKKERKEKKDKEERKEKREKKDKEERKEKREKKEKEERKEKHEKREKEEKKERREKKERAGSYEEVEPGMLRRATTGLLSRDKPSAERVDKEEHKKLARRSTAPQY